MTKTGVCHIPVELEGSHGLSIEGEIVARYTYFPSTPGEFRLGHPLMCPPEPAHVDVESAILKVKDKIVAGVSLDMLDADSIQEACWEHATAN